MRRIRKKKEEEKIMKKIGKFVITTEEEIYERVKKAVLENENYYDKKISNLKAECQKKIDTAEEHYYEKTEILIEQNRGLKEQYDEVVRSRAGFKSYNTILRKDKMKLEEKVKELQSNRYLVRQIPKDKTQSHHQPKIKSSFVQSNLVKKAHK